jgi:hypothetical protein
MFLPDSRGWLLDLLWTALLVGSLAVTVLLVATAIRTRARVRWIAVTLVAATVGTTLVTASFWIDAARVDGGYCTMDSLSAALASGVDPGGDRTCLDKSRRRVGVSGGVEFVVLAGSILWLRKRGWR